MTNQNIQPTFAIGNVVKLKSGGPDMAIKSLKMNKSSYVSEVFSGEYVCQWFAGKKLESGIFPQDSLIFVTKDDDNDE